MHFYHPTFVTIYGKSGEGKSSLIAKILNNLDRFFSVQIHEILYYYVHYQSNFKKLKNVTFKSGEIEPLKNDGRNRILIADDILIRKSSLLRLVDIALVESHHTNTTVFVVNHDLTMNRLFRSISLNCHVFILFHNKRDNLNKLFMQLNYPLSFLKAIYADCTKQRHSYLVINLQAPPELTFCGDLFDRHVTFYCQPGVYKGTPLGVKWHE